MGQLYIVPTPIGNLEDITLRAIRILKESDLLLAEDTRKTMILLKHYGIEKKMISHHRFNEHQTIRTIVEKVRNGLNIALVSDAGTPAISDPGYLLVRACLKEGLRVECLPGPTAFIPALVNSGIPADRFLFEGFLPHKKGRQTRLKELAEEMATLVFYESPYRLVKTLQQFREYFDEENQRGTLKELADFYLARTVKGEIVIIVEGRK
jgi:16S rRNA (cytidine1402-2'-O)-methyltransferase